MEFVYVSSVEGRLVPRFSTIMSAEVSYIGASRGSNSIEWNPNKIEAIPSSEWNRFRREYSRRIADKSLMKRDKKDYDLYRASAEAASKKDGEPPPPPNSNAIPTNLKKGSAK